MFSLSRPKEPSSVKPSMTYSYWVEYTFVNNDETITVFSLPDPSRIFMATLLSA